LNAKKQKKQKKLIIFSDEKAEQIAHSQTLESRLHWHLGWYRECWWVETCSEIHRNRTHLEPDKMSGLEQIPI